MEPDEINSYLEWKTQQQPVRDRKASQDFFKEEQKRLDEKLATGVRPTQKKQFKCFNSKISNFR